MCKAKKSDERKAAVAKEAGEAKEVLFRASINGESAASNTWLIDSGCSNHLTGNVSSFSELDKSLRARMKIRNGVYLGILGIGTVSVNIAFGIRFINDMYYVSEADHNF